MPSPSQVFAIALVLINLCLPSYLLLVLLVKYPPVRRWALYCHKGTDLLFPKHEPDAAPDNPEKEGFLINQVTSHFIETSDGDVLHSWLVLPLGVYTTHESVLAKPWSVDESTEIALQIIRSDPQAMLVLYLHGSGNNLASEDRCAAYRNLSCISSKHSYVLAFDYRGFGKSSGSPTEEGLIVDTLSVLSWIDKRLTIPKTKVLLVGQSLGCAVAVAAAQRIAEKDRYAEYAGLLLCACSTDTVRLAAKFRLGEVIPLLAPLTRTKWTRKLLTRNVVNETWKTEERLRALVRRCETVRVSILHAEDDERTPSDMAESLYNGCLAEVGKIGSMAESEVNLSTMGDVKEFRGGDKMVRRVMYKHGGHKKLMQWSTVAFEAAKLLTAAGAME